MMDNETTQPDAPENEAAATNGGSDAPAELTGEERLAKAEADAQKYLDNWRRAEADFQNYKRRTEQERDENRRFAGISTLMNLLPIVDDFERAFASIDGNLAALTWLDGLRLIYRKMMALLDNAGVKPIEADGKPFDPKFHEAVAHVEGPENQVISEVQRGYMLHDRVLRPAMVVVGKGTDGKKDDGSGK
jgi:molecular chaperone GrpE